MNWYRVVSALIEESLRRGWKVQCWHAKYRAMVIGQQENVPSREKMPLFKYGKPDILEYDGEEGLTKLLRIAKPDIIIDVDFVPLILPDYCENLYKKPLTVLIDGISNQRLRSVTELPRYDIFIAPSQWHVEQTLRVTGSSQTLFHEEIKAREKEFGSVFYRDLEKVYMSPWSPDDIDYYRSHAVVVGTTELDDLELIDRKEVRKKWGIPVEAPVVGYLPSPHDYPMGYFWGDLNMSKGLLQKLICCLKHKKFNWLKRVSRTPCDIDFVRGLKKFCKRNGAYCVAKLRHSRSEKSYLSDVADMIIGETGYHPHTVLELFKASDVVFGYTTSGALECVAAGTPYVDIEIPAFPKSFFLQHFGPSLEVTNKWDGVVWSLSAEETMNAFNYAILADFSLNTTQRSSYLSKFTTQCDGFVSARILDFCESKI